MSTTDGRPQPDEYPTGTAVPVITHSLDEPAPAELDWTEQDEADWNLRQRRYANAVEGGAPDA